jgi:hypothetical protein
MAVVINDMEVSPQPANPAAAQRRKAGMQVPKDKIKQMEKDMHKRQQRKHRLEAY